jgi:transcriptional regulator with XRE-family HTH domain
MITVLIAEKYHHLSQTIFEKSTIVKRIYEISLFVNKNSMIFHYYDLTKMVHDFRKNLRSELDFQGLTVKELSARTNIPIATLDCYLGTRATVPSVDAAFKIAQALQVSVEYLVAGEMPNVEKSLKTPNRKPREIIELIESLNSEQRKAIYKMIVAFKGNVKSA